ncbi:hypothetical protein AQ490_03890 [Wenjunlia vitaminophila]|uniref:OmpR/PhoB-type domain-containing protein n=1 Tax=Wenjunlia vitaminophila TaxID=76728 RepID=A0A0T6LQS9_WENVI|nr:BTAD domain-containing putative transcriptional regulator [Wenjunlia vitaminophila]KRV48406.1 hypothetical protein AQ490_03890 [Wenjunlia vitaminophila]
MRYLILGTTRARDSHGDAVPLGGARLRALLAALALRPGRAVPVEVLVDVVWGTRPPQDAGNALQALVSRLRRALGREAISSGPGSYRLCAGPEDVDLHVFEQLTGRAGAELSAGHPGEALRLLDDALALWRGPALADLPGRDAAAARPEALRLIALERRAEAALALGRHLEVIPELRELTAEHPLHEPFRVALIRALRAAGRDADALTTYEDTRRELADRLGADPGPALRALHRELLTGSAPSPPPPATGGPTNPTGPPAPAFPVAPQPAAPTPARRGNLRDRLTSFVGREEELAQLPDELLRARLVTLTGPGGSGKTRLSEELARALHPHYPDGTWVAELAPLDHATAVPDAVLNALGARSTAVYSTTRPDRRSQDASDPTARLVEHCAHQRLLLVMDNCEHLVSAVARLSEALLAACPGVTVLATSREPLGVPGELVRPVEPLPQPTAERLLTERATAVCPGFDPGQDPAAVAEICRRLDGLPLAIELAAARLRLLTPRQIADRLDDRFRLLTVGSRTALPRQQTLRAVVDWSWELLTPAERTLLRRLSVFAGGWTLGGAEAVCAGGEIPRDRVLHLLGALVDRSLLVAEQPREVTEDGVRYRMLETISEYASDRAAEHPDERAATVRRHTTHFAWLARTADPQLRGAGQMRWMARLEAEHDNVRAALRRCLRARDEDTALRISASMMWFWTLRNYHDECADWLLQAASLAEPAGSPLSDPGTVGEGEPADDRASPGPTATREPLSCPALDPLALGPVRGDPDDPRFLPRLGSRLYLLYVMADSWPEHRWRGPRTEALVRQVIDVYDQQGPHSAALPGIIWPFVGFLLPERPDISGFAERCVRNCRQYGGRWELAMALMTHALILTDEHAGLAGAERALAEAGTLIEATGDRWAQTHLAAAQADIHAARGDYPAARACLHRALRLSGELGALHREHPFLTTRLAEVHYRAGDLAAAEALARRADREGEESRVWDARLYARCLLAVILLHRDDVAGARDCFDLARRDAGKGSPPPMFQAMVHGLSARILVAEGQPRRALADSLVAVRTAVVQECDERLVASLLEWAALACVELGRAGTAARLLGSATTLRGRLPRSVPEATDTGTVHRAAVAVLGEQGYAEAFAEGSRLDRQGATALLAHVGDTPSPTCGAATTAAEDSSR